MKSSRVLRLLTVAQSREGWFVAGQQHYQKKIALICPFEIVEVPSPALSRNRAQQKIRAETEKLEKQIKPTDSVILCDEKGEHWSTFQFTKKLEEFATKKRIVIVVGGAFGVHEQIRARADALWAFSQLTLTHTIAQLVVLEQIYRALTIQAGLPYHNA